MTSFRRGVFCDCLNQWWQIQRLCNLLWDVTTQWIFTLHFTLWLTCIGFTQGCCWTCWTSLVAFTCKRSTRVANKWVCHGCQYPDNQYYLRNYVGSYRHRSLVFLRWDKKMMVASGISIGYFISWILIRIVLLLFFYSTTASPSVAFAFVASFFPHAELSVGKTVGRSPSFAQKKQTTEE